MYISLLLKTFVSSEKHVNATKVGATKDEELFKYSSHQNLNQRNLRWIPLRFTTIWGYQPVGTGRYNLPRCVITHTMKVYGISTNI